VTGMGFLVPRPAQLFLLTRQQGHAEPQTWAGFVWAIIEAQGQRFVKDGKALDSAQENLEELTAQAQTFALKRLPIFKAIGIAAWHSRDLPLRAVRSASAARAPPRRRRASHAHASLTCAHEW